MPFFQRTFLLTHHYYYPIRRNATSGIPIEPPQVSEQVLNKERKQNYNKLQAILPHTCGGKGSKKKDSQVKIQRAHDKSSDFAHKVFGELVELAESGEEGLEQFWRGVLTCPIQLLCIGKLAEDFIDALPPPANEILLGIYQERSDEIQAAFAKMSGKDYTKAHCDAYIHLMSTYCCNRIGELYEHVENFRGAIPWYERALHHAKQRSVHDTRKENEHCRKAIIAEQYCNLGLAQKRAGMLTVALENYDKSLELVSDEGNASGNRQTLLREMKEWTGSSERLSPGC